MSKGKLAKFADMAAYPHVFEYPFSVADEVPFEMKGRWNEQFFHNDHPIVLELGCGRGEYTVGLALDTRNGKRALRCRDRLIARRGKKERRGGDRGDRFSRFALRLGLRRGRGLGLRHRPD